jgi:hypothetical protein
MINRYSVLHERLQIEWQDVHQAAEKAMDAYQQLTPERPNTAIYLDSIALNLHGFYNGLERIFEWLARQIDGTIPEGASWHRDLLQQMSFAVPNVRPSVIQPETRILLEEFLGFRHVVRNLYTWHFEPEKISSLVAQLPETVAALDADFAHFRRFLNAATHADESEI